MKYKVYFASTVFIIILTTLFCLIVIPKIDLIFFICAGILFIAGFFLGCFKNLPIYFAFFILLFIPGELQPLITGLSYGGQTGKLNFHLIFFFLSGNLIQILTRKKKLLTRYPFLKKTLIAYVAFIFIELTIEISGLRGNGLSNFIFDIYISPLILFLVVVLTIKEKEQFNKIVDIFLLELAFVALIGIIEQFYYGFKPLYSTAYLQETLWYNNMLESMKYVKIYRNATTLGHFLINATYFLTGILLSLNRYLESKRLVYLVTVMLFFYNLIYAYSRAATIILILCTAAIILNDFKRDYCKKIIIVISILILSILFANQIATQFILKPINSSDSSLMARVTSVSMLMNGKIAFSFLGSGPYTASLLKNGQIGTNFEIGWLISAVEMGVLNFLLYVIALFITIKHSYKKNKNNINPYIFPLIAVILMFSTFNSFGNRTTVNCLLWLLMAFSVVFNKINTIV